MPLRDLAAAIRDAPHTRRAPGLELDGLAARGNRGDLDELRIAAICRPDALQGIRGCTFVGPTLLLGPAGLELDGSTVRTSVLGSPSVRASHVSGSVL